jgi:DNA uptake protein ComE-like DNA-binding protein
LSYRGGGFFQEAKSVYFRIATPININNASLDVLKGFTGISNKRAQKIIKKI